MAKTPSFQFYTGDWMKDPQLSMCCPATRGIWMDLLCAMHESDRSGIVKGTLPQLARLARCSEAEMEAALCELKATNTADVHFCPPEFKVICRRMHAEHKARQYNAEYKRQKRGKGDVRQKSSLHSSSSSSSSSSDTPCSPPRTGDAEPPGRDSAPPPAEEIAIDGFPLAKAGEIWGLPVSKLAEWQQSFPAIDVRAECMKARQWLRDNPARRKTAKGMPRFLGGWIERSVNSGRAVKAPSNLLVGSGARQPERRAAGPPCPHCAEPMTITTRWPNGYCFNNDCDYEPPAPALEEAHAD